MSPQIEKLREVRNDVRELSESVVEDLHKYVHQEDKRTFVRLPDSPHKKKDVGVTVTASCLMALTLTRRLEDFKKAGPEINWDPKASFELLFKDPKWTSSGLPQMNAFTSILVLRTFGFLLEHKILSASDISKLVHRGPTGAKKAGAGLKSGSTKEWKLADFFVAFASEFPNAFSVEKYPATAALVYWFVDAVQRSMSVQNFEETFWVSLAKWSATEFWKQKSLVVAKNDALMDPVAMAMAASLCKKLRHLSETPENSSRLQYLSFLPSESELESSIRLLFSLQASSGIWPKYFPLFHYPDAGGNFCFTFEMLEAVLNEFSKGDEVRILDIEGAFDGFRQAVQWCKRNRFEFQYDGEKFRGWNSGGQLKSLTSGKPESWATAVVHMFLWELEDALSRKIQQKLLTVYKAKKHKREEDALSALAEIDIVIQKNERKLLKDLLTEHIISDAIKDEPGLRTHGLHGKISALLFGPPGTSKTEMCTALAKRLGWPLLEIDPSHFLKGGLESISAKADEIFSDLLDLNGVVILFDEMDALVQTRDDEDTRLDITSQLLTTSMLPKLTKLHDRKRVVFFMATNFQNRFDPAIKRAGRFDLLLCMGPPRLQSKIDDLWLFMRDSDKAEVRSCSALLRKLTDESQELAQLLGLFTFGEFKAFLKHVQNGASLSDKLKAMKSSVLKDKAEAANEFCTLRIKDLDVLKQCFNLSSLKELEEEEKLTYDFLAKNEVKLLPIVRYLADRRQSKIQA
jgi:hypothetical protein